jgi:hypothetical protein
MFVLHEATVLIRPAQFLYAEKIQLVPAPGLQQQRQLAQELGTRENRIIAAVNEIRYFIMPKHTRGTQRRDQSLLGLTVRTTNSRNVAMVHFQDEMHYGPVRKPAVSHGWKPVE